MAEDEDRLSNSADGDIARTQPGSWEAGWPSSDSSLLVLPFAWIDWGHVRNESSAK